MAESRYNRQILVDGIGERGQERIRRGSIALVGVGALGCAIAQQLVRAGIGSIRLIDADVPEISNLQRQVLIDELDVQSRTPKADAAAAKLARANSEVRIESRVERFTEENARNLLEGADLVLDGTDNFQTRYLINRVCVELGIPWVFGGVLAMSGMSFPILPGGPCLFCALGPEPSPGSIPSTDQMGILAATVSSIASLEVVRALKILIGAELKPCLAILDLNKESLRTVSIEKNPDCPICGS